MEEKEGTDDGWKEGRKKGREWRVFGKKGERKGGWEGEREMWNSRLHTNTMYYLFKCMFSNLCSDIRMDHRRFLMHLCLFVCFLFCFV